MLYYENAFNSIVIVIISKVLSRLHLWVCNLINLILKREDRSGRHLQYWTENLISCHSLPFLKRFHRGLSREDRAKNHYIDESKMAEKPIPGLSQHSAVHFLNTMSSDQNLSPFNSTTAESMLSHSNGKYQVISETLKIPLK